MPRQARLDAPGALHHLMLRGINKASIFDDDQDRALFLSRLEKNITAADAKIYAWVLMTPVWCVQSAVKKPSHYFVSFFIFDLTGGL
jgi:hypothetical protein